MHQFGLEGSVFFNSFYVVLSIVHHNTCVGTRLTGWRWALTRSLILLQCDPRCLVGGHLENIFVLKFIEIRDVFELQAVVKRIGIVRVGIICNHRIPVIVILCLPYHLAVKYTLALDLSLGIHSNRHARYVIIITESFEDFLHDSFTFVLRHGTTRLFQVLVYVDLVFLNVVLVSSLFVTDQICKIAFVGDYTV